MIMTSRLRALHLYIMNIPVMTMDLQKLTLRWKSFMRKSQSKSLRMAMVINQQNSQHVSVSVL